MTSSNSSSSRSGVAQVRAAVAAHLPGYRIGAVVRLGEGLDNVAYEVNGELVVRFHKVPDPGRLDREARLLAAVAALALLPVPEPAFAVPELGCLAYPKLPGTPLLYLARGGHDTSVAATLGRFLAALHAVPVDRFAGLVEPDDQPLLEWRDEAAGLYRTVARRVPPAHRGAVEAFLRAAPPDGGYPLVFSHNDLGIEHVLVDCRMWTVAGVIDWTDAALVDPAYDLGLLYRDLGPGALRAAIDGYGSDLTDRAVFYARCAVLEDLAYGVEAGRTPYADKSLAALDWLFTTESRVPPR